MKVLIWVLSFIIISAINTIIGLAIGFKAGYIVVYFLWWWIASSLCKVWDKHKIAKQARKANITSFEYIKNSIPNEVLLHCEVIRQHKVDLKAYLKDCSKRKIIKSSFVDIVLGEFMLPAGTNEVLNSKDVCLNTVLESNVKDEEFCDTQEISMPGFSENFDDTTVKSDENDSNNLEETNDTDITLGQRIKFFISSLIKNIDEYETQDDNMTASSENDSLENTEDNTSIGQSTKSFGSYLVSFFSKYRKIILFILPCALCIALFTIVFINYNDLYNKYWDLDYSYGKLDKKYSDLKYSYEELDKKYQQSHNNNLLLENKYKSLKQAMLNVNGENYSNIGTMLNEFPLDYRDVEQIKNEYNVLLKSITTIKSTILTQKSCNELREAYATLSTLNSENSNWDLSTYLNSVYHTHYDKLIFGRNWYNSEYTFYWYEDGDGSGGRLSTNLPNDKDSTKSYYYYLETPVDQIKFGYVNQNDSTDKFLAFKIVDVTNINNKWQIKIYCYSNNLIYTLN